MQLMSTLFGTAGTKLGKMVLNELKESLVDNKFVDILKDSSATAENGINQDINLADLDLSPEELNQVLKLRELAIEQGQNLIQIDLKDQSFQMDVHSLDLEVV